MGYKVFDNLEHNEVGLMDSTAITTFMLCPRKYFYRMVLGYTTEGKQPYFAFGSAYHKFREVIEREWLAEPDKAKMPVYIMKGLDEASSYCDKHLVAPEKGSKWEWMTKARLQKSCILAANWWKNEKEKGAIKVITIEQPFQIKLRDGSIIAGRADQIVNFNGKLWGRDFKTSSTAGAYYVNSLNPNDQFTRYTFAENKLSGWNEEDINDRPLVQGQLIEVLFNNKTTEPKIEVYPAQRTRTELLLWLREQEYWHKMMDLCRKDDIWPMNPKSCTFCEYRRVCEMSSETSQMTFLKNSFKHNHWDCTKVEQVGE
jgi:CRISPR/Cas system-associated exonuclease Cas4 (RecB family)